MGHPEVEDGASPTDKKISIANRLERTRDGGPSAVGRLPDENRSWLRRKAKRLLAGILGRQADASDLAQERLIAAAPNLPRCRGTRIQAFRAGFSIILRNWVWAPMRRNSGLTRYMQVLPAGSDGQVLVAGGQTPVSAELQRTEEVARLRSALAEMDDDERHMIEERFFEGADYKRLAARTGLNEAALRQQLHRAIERLEMGMKLLAEMDRMRMPPHYRKILCAKRLRRWSKSQIADAFGLSQTAVDVLLKNADAWLPT